MKAAWLGLWLASGALGCGGGAPLLHPAHTLPEGAVSFAAGSSGRLTLGDLARAETDLDAAAGANGEAVTPEARARFVQGALSRFAVAPGVAPFVAARAGLGQHNEAGLTYSGRALRLDARHAFEWPSFALSLGLAASGAFSRAGDKPPRDVAGEDSGLRSVELTSLRGYGLELPVLVGYRSDADVVLLWAGLRAGLSHDTFDAVLVETPDELYGTSGEATRRWAGAVLGFSIGLPPIQVRAEIDGAYEAVNGHLLTGGGELPAMVTGWSLTPAMAICAKF